MGFWIFMFIMALVIPMTMVGFGNLFLKRTPKDINSVYGYRTRRSMKNQDTWRFAHQYCGKLWYYSGLLFLPISAAALFLVIGKDKDTVGLAGGIVEIVQLFFLVGAIFPTGRALKKEFDQNGRRRQQMHDT